MDGLAALLNSFELTRLSEGRFTAHPTGAAGDVVFGGQLLGLCVMAAVTAVPGRPGAAKGPQFVSIVFARSALVGQPLDVSVEPLHEGRALGSVSITIAQSGATCCTAIAVLSAAEPDLIRHADPMPTIDPPDTLVRWNHGYPWWDIRAVGNVDIEDPDLVGPASLDIWTRFPGAPPDHNVAKALLAYASDGFLIGTAMRPHPGAGQRLAHDTISTTVISHSIAFHEDFDPAGWLLLAHRSSYAGAGRSLGQAQVFDPAGRLVASYMQLNMIRHMPGIADRAPGTRSKH